MFCFSVSLVDAWHSLLQGNLKHANICKRLLYQCWFCLDLGTSALDFKSFRLLFFAPRRIKISDHRFGIPGCLWLSLFIFFPSQLIASYNGRSVPCRREYGRCGSDMSHGGNCVALRSRQDSSPPRPRKRPTKLKERLRKPTPSRSSA